MQVLSIRPSIGIIGGDVVIPVECMGNGGAFVDVTVTMQSVSKDTIKEGLETMDIWLSRRTQVSEKDITECIRPFRITVVIRAGSKKIAHLEPSLHQQSGRGVTKQDPVSFDFLVHTSMHGVPTQCSLENARVFVMSGL
jgi:hypothetical protein